MRLTLRTLLAYRERLLDPQSAREIEQKIAESPQAQELAGRLDCILADAQFSAPDPHGAFQPIPPNLMAQYLDQETTPEQTLGVEQVCMGSDLYLAEVAECLRLLNQPSSQPATVSPAARERILGLGRAEVPAEQPVVAAAAVPVGISTVVGGGQNELGYLTEVAAAVEYPAAESTFEAIAHQFVPKDEQTGPQPSQPIDREALAVLPQPQQATADVPAEFSAEDSEAARRRFWGASFGGASISLVLHAVAVVTLSLLLLPPEAHKQTPLGFVLGDQQEAMEFQETAVEFETPQTNITLAPKPPAPLDTTSQLDAPAGLDLDPRLSGNLAAGQGGQGEGGGEAGQSGKKAKFFGIEVEGKDFVYVVDCSGSMAGRRFERACYEVEYSIRRLSKDQRFYVLFFNHETFAQFYPDRTNSLAPATNHNFDRLKKWIEYCRPEGGTEPSGALLQALKLNPDVIFFLSDGEFSEQTVNVVKHNNSRGYTQIHTIAFGSKAGEHLLKQIASQNKGTYRFIALR